MAKVLSENAQKILTFLQTHDGDFTAADIANAVVDWVDAKEDDEKTFKAKKASANGTITGLAKKGLVVREEVEDGDKIIRLTAAGGAFDPETDKAE